MKIFSTLLMLCLALLAHPLAAQLHINELMADNSTTIADASGAYDDWIEVYNAGSFPVDLGGYYVSDDPATLNLWQIPVSNPSLTTVPANGFLLLWADKDTEEGELHLDLKLGSGGESLLLIAPDGSTIIDQLSFGPQNTDVSYGRSVDGGPDFQLFTSPSPNASNEAIPAVPTFNVTIQRTVNATHNDAIEYGISSGGVRLDAYGMVMTESWSNQTIGLRFEDVLLPPGSTITQAHVQFTTKDPSKSTGYSRLEIKGERSAHAAPFEDESFNITDRPLTSGRVVWEPEEWMVKEFAGLDQKTPDLSAILQEVIDQSNWEAGNAIAIVLSGEGKRSAHNYTSHFPPSIQIQAEAPVPQTPISKMYINEIAPNGTEYPDETDNFEDWIEIYNDNDFDVSLGGLYLTDNLDDLTKWQIASVQSVPAKGFITFWADQATYRSGRHADFSLKDEGESVALVQALNNELIIIDSITYGDVPFKASFGRTTELADSWQIFGAPTPLAANANAPGWLAKPDINLDNGVFSSPQLVSITHVDPTVTIRYTTDGSDPDADSKKYTGPFNVDETSSVRARAFRAGFANSQITTRSYLFDPSADLPVLMISTDPDNLWDDEIGIYTVGTNGISVGFCSNYQPANYWQDWERPAKLTLFEPDGQEAFAVKAGIRISGNCSRKYALKSLNIYLRNNQYGDKNIDYKLFPGRDYKKYKRLRLRNSGQDYRNTMFRDGVNHRILADITDVEYQSYRPTLVYINGEYYGIQNFRDLYGGEYFDAFFDVKETELDLIKSPRLSHDIKEGDDQHYQDLYEYVDQHDMSQAEHYQYVRTQLDIENFLDYWIAMIYMSSSDWPANNIQIWRPRNPEGKWRYMYIDTDATTNIYGTNSASGHRSDRLEEVLDPDQEGWPSDSQSTLFIRKLLENDDFQAEFVQRACSFMELVFNEDRTNTFIDEAVATIGNDIERHVEHWAFDNPYRETYEEWEGNVVKYRRFFEERPPYFFDQLDRHFDLDDTYELSFNYDEMTNGDVFVNWNQMSVPYHYTGTYYTQLPLRVTAIAKSGYRFSHWLETGETSATIEFVASHDATLTPIFEVLDCSLLPPGTPCNDGDECTIDDQYDHNCICRGTFADDDNDGVCNSDDQCPGFDDSVDTNGNGLPDGCENCLDGDDDSDGVCNSDDQCPGFDDSVDTNGNGIPDGCEACPDGDDDLDGICKSVDCDDNNPNLPTSPGSLCDDDNPLTVNDQIQSDGCSCAGEAIDPNPDNCDSEGEKPWQQHITNVTFGSINNDSGKDGYGDFTDLSTVVTAGTSQAISLLVKYSYTQWDEYFRVWIDYNQDGDFADAGELAFSGITYGGSSGDLPAPLTGEISIPSSAHAGATRMRVSMKKEGYAEPCEVFEFGEVEDYSVVIEPGNANGRSQSGTDDTLLAEDIRLFPNPAQNRVYLSAPPLEDQSVIIRLHNHLGQVVRQLAVDRLAAELLRFELGHLADGLYFFTIQSEGKLFNSPELRFVKR